MTSLDQVGKRLFRDGKPPSSLCIVQQLFQHRGRKLAVGNGQRGRTGTVLADLQTLCLIGFPERLVDFVRKHIGGLLAFVYQHSLSGRSLDFGAGLANHSLRFALKHLNQRIGTITDFAHPGYAVGHRDRDGVGLDLKKLSFGQGLVQSHQNRAVFQADSGLAAFGGAGGFQTQRGILLAVDLLVSVHIQNQLSAGINPKAVITVQQQAILSLLGGLIGMNDFHAGAFQLNFAAVILRVNLLRFHFFGAAAQRQQHCGGQQDNA